MNLTHNTTMVTLPGSPESNKDGVKGKKGGSPTATTARESSTSSFPDPDAWEFDDGLLNRDTHYKSRQEGFPEQIKEKKYKSTEEKSADDLLDEDLEKFGLAENRKWILLSKDGIAYWDVMPRETIFHSMAVQAIEQNILTQLGVGKGYFVKGEQPMPMDGSDFGRAKHPDVAIYRADRLDEEDGTVDTVKVGNTYAAKNPNLVIEFSWSNEIENELDKINEQLADHLDDLGPVYCGILIKSKLAKGTKYPMQGEEKSFTLEACPLCGFDVYFVERTNLIDLDNPEPDLKYRHGTAGDEEIVVAAGKFGTGSMKFSIDLRKVQRKLEKLGVVFEAEQS